MHQIDSSIFAFTLKQKELIKSVKLWSFLKLFLTLCMTKLSRFLAKILVPDGSKDVPVGQPIAVMVICDYPFIKEQGLLCMYFS